MRSDIHKELQQKGRLYLLNKGYWICGEEVPMPSGICDVWGMSRANNLDTMAIEVKISKADARSPSQKHKEFSSLMANKHYILCPAGLLSSEDINKNWGLLWWSGQKIQNKKIAPNVEMTDRQKLDILIYFLHNGVNINNRPRLDFVETLEEIRQAERKRVLDKVKEKIEEIASGRGQYVSRLRKLLSFLNEQEK